MSSSRFQNNKQKNMKKQEFRVSLAVSVPMNFEAFVIAENEEEAVKMAISHFRRENKYKENNIEGDFEIDNAEWDNSREEFDEETHEGIYAYCEDEEDEEDKEEKE